MSGGQVQLPIVYFTAHRAVRIRRRAALRVPPPDADERGWAEDRDAVLPGRREGADAVCDPRSRTRSCTSRTSSWAAPRGRCRTARTRCRSVWRDVKRKGEDVTVVAIGALVNRALAVADQLAERDLGRGGGSPHARFRSTPRRSWSRCERPAGWWCVDNARMTCSAASEIVAMVASGPTGRCKAAPRRVALGERAGTVQPGAGGPSAGIRRRHPRRGRLGRGRGCAAVSAVDVVLPKWGMSMQEGTITEWYVEVGDEVLEGDVIAEVETEKVNGEVEAPPTARSPRSPSRPVRDGRGRHRCLARVESA